MAGMRDKLIHSYFGTDYAAVWETIQDVLPEVKPAVEQIILRLQA